MKFNKSTFLGFLGMLGACAVTTLISQKQQSDEIRDIIEEYEQQKAGRLEAAEESTEE